MTITYATWNPSDKNTDITLSGSNLTATCVGGAAAMRAVRGTVGHSSGKHYFEVVMNARGLGQLFGIATASASLSTQCGLDAFGWSYYGDNGNKYNSGSSSAYGATYSTGDVISIALDLDVGKLWFAKNGTWQASGNPATGANAAFASLSGTFFPMWSADYVGPPFASGTANFGVTTFAYTPPSGFNVGWYSGGSSGGGAVFMTPSPLNGLGS